MTFGEAVEQMIDFKRMTRKGWNGKSMFVYLDGSIGYIPPSEFSNFPVQKFFVMKTAQNTLQPGWLASQMDMLADDWEVFEENV